MLQRANTNLFNPLVPKAHNNECQNLLFPLQIKSVIAIIGGFLFFDLRHLWVNASFLATQFLRP